MLTEEDLRQIEKVVEKKIRPLDKKINIILHYFDDKESHFHFSS